MPNIRPAKRSALGRSDSQRIVLGTGERTKDNRGSALGRRGNFTNLSREDNQDVPRKCCVLDYTEYTTGNWAQEVRGSDCVHRICSE